MNSNNLYRILVVDDEETLCEALRYNLESEGFTVDVAYSAEEALSLPLQSYSLILLDIMMGAISGMQFAEIIKSRADTTAIPVIFCTAKDAEDGRLHHEALFGKECACAGAHGAPKSRGRKPYRQQRSQLPWSVA